MRESHYSIKRLEWNPSKMDTTGELRFVLYKEVSLVFKKYLSGPTVG